MTEIDTSAEDVEIRARFLDAAGCPDAAATLRALVAMRDALAAFKAYTHERLDGAGIPTHPGGPHSAAGCRVGDRFDLLIRERDAAADDARCAEDAHRLAVEERDAARADVARMVIDLAEILRLVASRPPGGGHAGEHAEANMRIARLVTTTLTQEAPRDD